MLRFVFLLTCFDHQQRFLSHCIHLRRTDVQIASSPLSPPNADVFVFVGR